MSSVRRTGSDHRVTNALVIGAGVATAIVAYAPGVSTWLQSLGSGCPLVRFCGWQCPFCGMTRGTVALLHGDLGEMLTLNPFSIVFVLGLLVMMASVVGLPLRTTLFGHRRLNQAGVLGGSLIFISYAVTRNLV